MADGQFDKDFGYLMPFLDKVAAAAQALADPAARAELTKLLADEKQRWARARQLLSGAGASPAATDRAPVAAKPPDQPPRQDKAEPARSFTVGSLRPRG